MKRWTPEEENELRELYGTTYRAIYQKCNKMGLKKDQPCKIHLTPQQELWMKIHWPHMSNEICALILGISHRSVVRQARRLGLQKTEQFMKECQAHTSKRAKESHIKNGTYPAKGYYSPNLQKGEAYQFKPGHKVIKKPF